MAQALPGKIKEAITSLLKDLIAIPSFSKEEGDTAQRIFNFLDENDVPTLRKGNNVWARNKNFDENKPTILLNSHHDTVKPNSGYTRNPFRAQVENGKLYGLGSNDAGGALVALAGTFLTFYEHNNLPFNIVFAATAEEEISGVNGIESIIGDLGKIELAIVGEPTQMKMAVAERGLLVLDCITTGKAGHAARNEGINAIYVALPDIEWFRTFKFSKTSHWLGPVSMNVTIINAGSAHNQVPARCNFAVDIRLNECYTHREVLDTVRSHVKCEVKERSTRISPSFIETANPFVQTANQLGMPLFGSPTTSDMALMPWKAVKTGPGDSARSHCADEFIFLQEIEDGLNLYCKLLESYAQQLK